MFKAINFQVLFDILQYSLPEVTNISVSCLGYVLIKKLHVPNLN